MKNRESGGYESPEQQNRGRLDFHFPPSDPGQNWEELRSRIDRVAEHMAPEAFGEALDDLDKRMDGVSDQEKANIADTWLTNIEQREQS